MNVILLIEDDPLNILFIKSIFEKDQNYTVISSENVIEIIELSKNKMVKLILMDISLDNSQYNGSPIDGIGISKLIKLNPKSKHIPIVLLTGHINEDKKQKYLISSSAEDYITKPILDPDIFYNTIMGILNKS